MQRVPLFPKLFSSCYGLLWLLSPAGHWRRAALGCPCAGTLILPNEGSSISFHFKCSLKVNNRCVSDLDSSSWGFLSSQEDCPINFLFLLVEGKVHDKVGKTLGSMCISRSFPASDLRTILAALMLVPTSKVVDLQAHLHSQGPSLCHLLRMAPGSL